MKRSLSQSVYALISLLFTCALAIAQDTDKPAGGLEIASVKGTVEAIAGDRIKIKSEDATDVFAILSSQTTTRYQGTADSRVLMPSQLVRFTAPFNPQSGIPQAAIKELEIFRIVQQRRMSKEQVENQTPGIYPVAQEKKEKRGKKVEPPPAGSENFRIVGQIRAIQGDKMQVQAGLRPIIVQLDPALTIRVSAGDAWFCVAGDSIEISGLRNPAQPSLVQAETVEITGTKPLGKIDESKTNSRTKTNRSQLGETKKPKN